jgi:hypothetical protein
MTRQPTVPCSQGMLAGMRLAALILAGCSSGGAWKPVVWTEAPADPKARPIAYDFPDGTNGTELVIGVLAGARESTGVSKFEIQVGPCTREIAVQPRAGALEPIPALDRITARVRETEVHCKRSVDQVVTHDGPKETQKSPTAPAAPPGGPAPPPTNRGNAPAGRFGDAQLVQQESCDQQAVEHVVTRYRFELDHGFVPPDWAEVARFTGTRLAFGTPRCSGEPKNEIRAVLHSVSAPRVAAPPARPGEAAAILELVKRAEAAAAAKRPGEATALAEQALAAVATGEPMLGLDDARATELAERIAAAHFFAIEMEVDMFLHRELPAQVTETWGAEIGAEIDRIAKRYERIKDVVRVPGTVRWLRAGAGRLADLHEHTAKLLDAAHQPKAAELERARARELAAASK